MRMGRGSVSGGGEVVGLEWLEIEILGLKFGCILVCKNSFKIYLWGFRGNMSMSWV